MLIQTSAVLEFFVPGVPAPGGSKKAFRHYQTGKIIVTDDAKGNRDWMSRVAHFAQQAHEGPLLDEPLAVAMTFTVLRPKSHYRTGRYAGQLRPSAPVYPTKRPDVLKLARSTEDALTGVVWRDDSSTVILHIDKRYGEEPGAWIRVERLEGGESDE